MRQFDNAVDASRGTGHGALGIARLRINTQSDCRRAATQGAPSYIAALPNFQIATLIKTFPSQTGNYSL